MGESFSSPRKGTMVLTPDDMITRNNDILYAPAGDDAAVMMSVEAGLYYGLNAVGARIWELLDRPRKIGDLCEELAREFEIDPRTCEESVSKFMAQMADNGIIHVAGA